MCYCIHSYYKNPLEISIFALIKDLIQFFSSFAEHCYVKSEADFIQPGRSLVDIGNALVVFQIILILIARFNSFMNACAMQAHTVIAAVMAVACLFATIKLYGKINFFAYMIFPCLSMGLALVALVISRYFATLLADSNNFRNSWKKYLEAERCDGDQAQSKIRDAVLFRRFQSCPDLKIHMGQFYYYNKSTPTTFSQIVLDNTISLLLTC